LSGEGGGLSDSLILSLVSVLFVAILEDFSALFTIYKQKCHINSLKEVNKANMSLVENVKKSLHSSFIKIVKICYK
jgi:hypothetical protein